jgi:Mor family transcriptional regulator
MSKERDFFKKPQSLFEQQMNDLFERRPESEMDDLLRIVSFIVDQNTKSDYLRRLYRELPLEHFIKVVEIFDGRTINFPKKNVVREALILAVVYNARELEGKSWEEIHKELPFEVSAISYNSKIQNLNSHISNLIHEAFGKEKTDE